MNNLGIIEGFVALVLLVAVITDLREQKIANGITLPMWPVGILWHVLSSEEAWYFGILGFAIAFPIHFLFWMVGLDKGGDAKLMIGLGACLGWLTMLESTLWAILLMLPVGIVFITFQGKLKNFLRSLKYLFTLPYYQVMKLDPGEAPPQTYIPKAPVIAIATGLAVTTQWIQTLVIG